MKTQFKHFYPEDNIDIDDLDSGKILICLDANVMLNIYRYSDEIRKLLFNAFKKYRVNIFIPYNAAYEFNYNKKSILYEIMSYKEKEVKFIDLETKKFINLLTEKINNNNIIRCNKAKETRKDITDNLKKIIDKSISTWKNNEFDKYIVLYNELSKKDEVSNILADTLSNNVGSPYDQAKVTTLSEIAKSRYEKNIPPGYDDKDKEDIYYYFLENDYISFKRKYSHFLIWNQIIEYTISEKDKYDKVLFLTDDNTEDWIFKKNGQTIGMRAELRNEFYEKTKKYIKILNTNSFLQLINNNSDNYVFYLPLDKAFLEKKEMALEEQFQLERKRALYKHLQLEKENLESSSFEDIALHRQRQLERIALDRQLQLEKEQLESSSFEDIVLHRQRQLERRALLDRQLQLEKEQLENSSFEDITLHRQRQLESD